MTSTALLADTQRVYRSRERDTWEILQKDSQYTWRRTATNKEIVGTSHKAFTTAEEAESNARLFGFEGAYNVTPQTEWKFFRNQQGSYRWTAKLNDELINKAHEGYVSEKACLLNAVRHGYNGHLDATAAVKTATPKQQPKAPASTDASQPLFDNFIITWLIVLIVLVVLLGLLLKNLPLL